MSRSRGGRRWRLGLAALLGLAGAGRPGLAIASEPPAKASPAPEASPPAEPSPEDAPDPLHEWASAYLSAEELRRGAEEKRAAAKRAHTDEATKDARITTLEGLEASEGALLEELELLEQEHAMREQELELLGSAYQQLPAEGYALTRVDAIERIVAAYEGLADVESRMAENRGAALGVARRVSFTVDDPEAREEILLRFEASLGRWKALHDAAGAHLHDAEREVYRGIGRLDPLDEEALSKLEETRLRLHAEIGLHAPLSTAEHEIVRTNARQELEQALTPATPRPEEPFPLGAKLLWAATGASFLVMGGGIVLSTKARVELDRLPGSGAAPCPYLRPSCAEQYDAIQKWKDRGSHGNRMVVGGALAGGFLALSATVWTIDYLTKRKKHRDREARLSAAVSPHAVGLTLTGRF